MPATRKREITKTYDYTDPDGSLLYQVCRQEWIRDGERKKTFLQRRPYGAMVDDKPTGGWIWGLLAGIYLRGRNGDFYVATDDGSETGRADRTRSRPHLLYRWPELPRELVQDEAERRDVFICEGEKDVLTLVSWDCCATTNSGGAGNWQPEHSEEFRGCDANVIVLEDNDQAGRKRTLKIAPSLAGVARSFKVLRLPEHWPDCPLSVATLPTGWRRGRQRRPALRDRRCVAGMGAVRSRRAGAAANQRA